MRSGLFLVLALVMAAVASPAPAQPPPAASNGAFLNITPKRIIFDRARRNGVVYLLNQGAAPITVDIGLVDRVMLSDGQIAPIDDVSRADEVKAVAAGLKSAQDLLQVSPRRVTLQPGRPQTVRVRLSTLPDAATGEHRTHLTVMTLPPPDTGVTADQAASGAGPSELRFQITAVYGLSIPLIVRPADPQVGATLEGARLEYAETPADGRNPPRRAAVVAFDVVRGGASSVYGNLEVRVVGGAKGAEPLGAARGVGVYPEIARRAVRIPLSRSPAPGERLEVTFTDDDTSPGKVLAKAAL